MDDQGGEAYGVSLARNSINWEMQGDANGWKFRAARILKNKAGRDVTGVKWAWPQVGEAFRDPQLWFSMINAFLSSVPNG